MTCISHLQALPSTGWLRKQWRCVEDELPLFRVLPFTDGESAAVSCITFCEQNKCTCVTLFFYFFMNFGSRASVPVPPDDSDCKKISIFKKMPNAV